MAVPHGDLGDHEPGRHLEPDGRDRLGHRHHPGLHQHRRDPHGAVAAHWEQPTDLDEQDAVVGVRAGRRLQDRPTHRSVTTRLVHQEGAEVVGVLHEPQPALGHARARQHADTAGHHPGRHPLRVRVDGADQPRCAHLSPFVALVRGSAARSCVFGAARGVQGGRTRRSSPIAVISVARRPAAAVRCRRGVPRGAGAAGNPGRPRAGGSGRWRRCRPTSWSGRSSRGTGHRAAGRR